MRGLAADGLLVGGVAGEAVVLGVDSDVTPGMMRGPPAGGFGRCGGAEKSSSRGVDRRRNPCMMGGSLGRCGGRVEGKGAEATPADL